MTMETRCCQKKMTFKDTRHKISVPLAISTKSSGKKSSKLSNKKQKKYFLGRCWPRSAWEKLSQMLIGSGEIPSPRHWWTKPTYAPWKLNGARSLGAPTRPLVTVFTKRPVIRGRRRPGVWYKHIWAQLCRKQATKNLDPSSIAESRPFFQVWEKSVRRRQQLLTPYTTDPPDIFEAAIYIHWPCPTLCGLSAGWFYVEIEGLSLRELFLISVLTIFNVKAQVPPRAAA